MARITASDIFAAVTDAAPSLAAHNGAWATDSMMLPDTTGYYLGDVLRACYEVAGRIANQANTMTAQTAGALVAYLAKAFEAMRSTLSYEDVWELNDEVLDAGCALNTAGMAAEATRLFALSDTMRACIYAKLRGGDQATEADLMDCSAWMEEQAGKRPAPVPVKGMESTPWGSYNAILDAQAELLEDQITTFLTNQPDDHPVDPWLASELLDCEGTDDAQANAWLEQQERETKEHHADCIAWERDYHRDGTPRHAQPSTEPRHQHPDRRIKLAVCKACGILHRTAHYHEPDLDLCIPCMVNGGYDL